MAKKTKFVKLVNLKKLPIRSVLRKAFNFAKTNVLHLLTLLALISVLFYLFNSYNSNDYINVLTADTDLIAGQKLKNENITSLKLPKSANLKGLIPESNKSKIISYQISTDVKKGDLILAQYLYKDGDETSPNNDQSKKIYYLSSNDVEIIPFNTNPNDKVSVFGIEPKTNKQAIVLNQVRVLNIDKASKEKGKFPTFVALELNDDEIFAINNAISNKWFLQMVLYP